jgi:hypothetical protein
MLELSRDLGIMPYYWYRKFDVAKPQYDAEVNVLSATQGNHTITTPIVTE